VHIFKLQVFHNKFTRISLDQKQVVTASGCRWHQEKMWSKPVLHEN